MITLSKISSINTKKRMALITIARTDLTICQRSTSRWSIKLISDSSSPPVLRRLKNDWSVDRKLIFRGVKLRDFEMAQLPNSSHLTSLFYPKTPLLQFVYPPPANFHQKESIPVARIRLQSYSDSQSNILFHDFLEK